MGRDGGGERHGSVKQTSSSLCLFFSESKLEMDARTTVQRAVLQKCGYVVKLKLVAQLAGGAAAFRLRNPAFG